MEFRRYSAIVPGCQGIRQGLGASQAQTRPWSVVAAMTDPVQPKAVGVPGQPVKTATGDPMALKRSTNRRAAYAERWWLHVEPRTGMRAALDGLDRYLATPILTKHRLFVWLPAGTLPDHQIIAVARDDDYTFGVLHSRVHDRWARGMGTQLREVESGFRYTPTTCFETFPFPHSTDEQRFAIATAAANLDRLRQGWLNPPDRQYDLTDRELARRTLTNLYNQNPTWLQDASEHLDAAVLAAYGWPHEITDEELLGRLLELNMERADEGGLDRGS